MSSHQIAAENLGPITSLSFTMNEPGVTVLVAPNGSGKTILLEAVQAAARGEGKLPLRDRTKRGRVEAFGATITIGGTCRHTGSFEVTNLEGRFDLAALVDPRLKSPTAADRARIKALAALTGVAADAALFKEHEAFEDFDTVVSQEALATDDIIEMAQRIKDCYDSSALTKERLAEREYGQATALIAPADVDLTAESNATVLQAAYNAARDEVIRLQEQARSAEKAQAQFDAAKKMVEDIGGEGLLRERDTLTEFLEGVDTEVDSLNAEILELTTALEKKRAALKDVQARSVTARARVATINRQISMVEEAKTALSNPVTVTAPKQADLDAAKAEMEKCEEAIRLGERIRQATANQQRMADHRTKATEAESLAARYRDAGKATDEVLSNCINCSWLRVESDGKSARLVTDTARGESIAYHELSDGERWKIAIDIGADQVKEGGLLVISQIGWEGIDGANRLAIHNHAKARGVYILTAEAASDPEAAKKIIPKSLSGVAIPVESAPVEEKPKAEKKPARATKAPAAPAAPAPIPEPEPTAGDPDEIPF